MIALNIVMILLLAYQVNMPAVDNAKFSMTVYGNELIRMNTQNGTFERCNTNLQCVGVNSTEKN